MILDTKNIEIIHMDSKIVKSFIKEIRKNTVIQKLFYSLVVLVIIILINKLCNQNSTYSLYEGFEETQKEKYITLKDNDMYDNFYSQVYDDLLFDDFKNNFEISEIIGITKPPKGSYILDIGSGTGHHVAAYDKMGYKGAGIDLSQAMVNKSKKNFPKSNYIHGNIMNSDIVHAGSIDLITSLFFTTYYIKDKRSFFTNCHNWLKKNGYLAIHLVDRNKFDPIITAADPLTVISAQSYAKERITSSVVKFNTHDYKANFVLDNNKEATMHETFKEKKTGKLRKHEHKLYMPTQNEALSYAKDVGFKLVKVIDMTKTQMVNQYIYILQKI